MTNVLGLIGALSWILFRGIFFVIYLVYPVFDRFVFHPIEDKIAAEYIYWPSVYISMMLWALLVMDYIWIGAMVKALALLIFPKNKNINK